MKAIELLKKADAICTCPARGLIVEAIAELERQSITDNAEKKRMREENRWIPVSERLPELGQQILVQWTKDSQMCVLARRNIYFSLEAHNFTRASPKERRLKWLKHLNL